MSFAGRATCLGCDGPLEAEGSTLRCPRCGTGVRFLEPGVAPGGLERSAPHAAAAGNQGAGLLSAFLFGLGGLAGLGLFVLGLAGFSFRRMYADVGAAPRGATALLATGLPFLLGVVVLALAALGFSRALRRRPGAAALQLAALVAAALSMVVCLVALYLPIFQIAGALSGE